MRAIVVVVVAVVSLLGLGWYFSNSQLSKGIKTQAASDSRHVPVTAPAPAAKPTSPEVAARSVLNGASGEENASENGGDNEVVGKYIPRQMVHPNAPSAAKHVPMDDDLLVMENRSEDRLSATR